MFKIKKIMIAAALCTVSSLCPLGAMENEISEVNKLSEMSSSFSCIANKAKRALLEGNNPFLIMEDMCCMIEARQDYHFDLVKTFIVIEGMNQIEQKEKFFEMYGVSFYQNTNKKGRAEIKNIFESMNNFHRSLVNLNLESIKKLNKVNVKYKNYNNFKKCFDQLISESDESIKVFTRSKADVENLIDKKIGSVDDYSGQNILTVNNWKSWISDFLISEVDDCISFYTPLISKLKYLKVLISLVVQSKEFCLEEIVNELNEITYSVVLKDKGNIKLEPSDFFSIYELYSKQDHTVSKKYLSVFKEYTDKTTVKKNVVKEKPKKQKIVTPRLPVVETKPITEIVSEDSLNGVLENSSKIVSQEFSSTSVGDKSQLSDISKEETKILSHELASPLMLSIEPVKNTVIQSEKGGEKKTKAQIHQNIKVVKGQGGSNSSTSSNHNDIKQIPISSYDIYASPLFQDFGKNQLDTLDDIVKLAKNIKWGDFVKLIESSNGFDGTVTSHGGSAHTVEFYHPSTGKRVIFTVHKPHRPAQSSDVLYLALTKRIKMKLEENGLLG